LNKKNVIGQMRHTLRFLTPTVTKDANGSESITWVEGSDVWCNLEYKESGSDEDIFGSRISATTNVLATLRYNSAINEKMRVKADGDEWNIKSVLYDDWRQFMRLELELQKNSEELA